MLISILFIFGWSLFLARGSLPVDVVLIYPLLCAVPAVVRFYSCPRMAQLKDFRVLRFLTDIADTYILVHSLAFFVSLALWLYVPAENMMFSIQRPQLYEEFLAYTQHAGFAVFLFGLSFYASCRVFYRSTPRDALEILEVKKPAHVTTGFDVRSATMWLVGLSVVTYVCRLYSYTQGKANFESEVYFENLGGAASLFAILSSVGTLSPGAAFYLGSAFRQRWILKIAVLLLLGEMMFGAYYGTKSNVLQPAVMSAFAYILGRREMPGLRALVLCGLVVLLLTTVAQAKRSAFRAERERGYSGFVENWWTSLTGRSDPLLGVQSNAGMSYYSSRFNVAIPIMGAVASYERNGPAKSFGGYMNAALTLVPTFIFPWKPPPFSNNEFGRRVGLLADNDGTTSVRPTIVGESYYNFGPLGCIAVGLVSGAIIGLLSQFMVATLVYGKPLFVYVALYAILDIENSFSLSYGGLIKNLFILVVILKFASNVPLKRAAFNRFAARTTASR